MMGRKRRAVRRGGGRCWKGSRCHVMCADGRHPAEEEESVMEERAWTTAGRKLGRGPEHRCRGWT